MSEPIRVLHVDDDLEFADLTAEFLHRESDRMTAVTVRSPAEARQYLADETVDCIVSDYEMAPEDGIEFLESVREEYPDLPFILFTGRGSEAIASEAISAGATDYLQKGTGTSQYAVLANRIENAVSQYRAQHRSGEENRRRERELERERERFSALFEALPEPTFAYEYVDGEPIIREINDAFEQTFGYDAGTAVGEHVDDLVVPPDRLSEAETIDERVRAGEFIDREVVRQTATGERQFYLRNIPLSLADGIDGFAVYADIHERKRREERLERKNERLNQFVSIVSHDLRNPLNVASARLTLAREDCNSEHLDVVESAHDRIGTIIEDTLTLARQGESVDEMAVIDLPTLARRGWEAVRTGEASLEVPTDLSIRADADRLRHVLENLFRNSVEHGSATPPSQSQEDATGGDDGSAGVSGDEPVTVTVGVLDGEPGFYVADDGTGLPDDREDLFEAGVSTRQDGTGFGLTIVREVVEAHGWEVSATDSETGGARFEITGVDVVE
jgi:PAS domain S-box-containing protein